MIKREGNTIAGSMLLYGLGGLFALPLVFMLVLSLADGWPFPALFPESWSLRLWAGILLGENALGSSLFLSLGLGLATALIATGLALPVSQAISRHSRRRLWLFLAYFPFVLAPVMYATTLRLYFVKFGLIASVPGILLGHLLVGFPFAVLVLEGGWSHHLDHLAQQAKTLGARPGQVYRRVILPAFRGLLAVCLFQTFLISWFEYGLTSLLGLGQIKTLPINVYQFIQESSPAYAALACCLLMLPPVILLVFNRRWLVRKLA